MISFSLPVVRFGKTVERVRHVKLIGDALLTFRLVRIRHVVPIQERKVNRRPLLWFEWFPMGYFVNVHSKLHVMRSSDGDYTHSFEHVALKQCGTRDRKNQERWGEGKIITMAVVAPLESVVPATK